MSLDPIVQEVRDAREAYAKRFNFDLEAIYRDLKEQEKRNGHQLVSFPPRLVQPPESAPGESPAQEQ